MKKVRITPLSKRARNRVSEHGSVMRVVQEGTYEGSNAILCESMEKTWGGKDFKQVWIGWITRQEATWMEIPE